MPGGSKFVIDELDSTGQPDGVNHFEWDAAHHSSPQRGWPYSVRLRTVREDYAGGSAPPTEQVLGWSFEPFTLEGVWDDRYNYQGFAEDARTQFEAMVQRGNLVRLQFEGLIFEGVITQFNPLYRRYGYVPYAFTVSPHRHAHGDFRDDLTGPEVKKPDDIQQILNDLLVQAQLSQDLAPFQVTYTEVYATVQGALERMQRDAALLNDYLGYRPNRSPLVKQVLATLDTVSNTALSIVDAINNASSDDAQAFADPIAEIAYEIWARFQGKTARDIVLAAAEAEAQLSAVAGPDITLYRPQAGESLYSISQRFYGTPFEWQTIADVNNLHGFLVDSTQLLIIPPSAQAA